MDVKIAGFSVRRRPPVLAAQLDLVAGTGQPVVP